MFFSLQQSAFLHALGSAIGNSLWQIAALWLVFAAISGLSKLNAANRYRLAVAFSMAGFLWFMFSLVSTYIKLPSSGSFSNLDSYQNATATFMNEGFGTKASFVYHSFLTSLNSLSPYISCAYLFVWLLLTTRLVNGFRQVRQFGTQGLGTASHDILAFVEHHAALLQIKKNVSTFTSEFVQGPLTIGFFKPIILLPIASMSNLSPAQVEAILLHELAHIKRHDYLVNIFVQVAEISLFFNPFMRLLLKEIKQERENCCDDYVLQFEYNAADYAKALLGIAQNRTATLLAMAARNSQFQLLNRVKRMVAPQPQTFNYRQQLSLLLLLTFLGFVFTIISPSQAIIKPSTKKAVTKNIYPGPIKETAQIQTEDDAASKPFDFVTFAKSAIRISQLDPKKNAAEIDKEASNIERHGKELELQAKQMSEDALKNAQPMIENAEKFAKEFSEDLFIPTPDDMKALEKGDISSYVNSIFEKTSDAKKRILNKSAAPFVSPVPPAPPVPISMTRGAIAKKMMLERKVLLNQDQIQAQINRARRSMDSLLAASDEKMENQQEMLKATEDKLAALKSKNNWDIAFEQRAEQEGLLMAQKSLQRVFNGNFKIKLPHNIHLKNLDHDLRIQLQNNNQNLVNEDGESIEITTPNVKSVNVHQKTSTNNGKEENVIIINFNSSK